MYLVDVGHGTSFTISYEDGTEYSGVFDGRIDHMSFYIHCPDIQEKLDKFVNTQPLMTFFGKESFYTFTGLILGKSDRKNHALDTIDVKIITPFKSSGTGRVDIRINITFKVKIHHFVDDQKNLFLGDFICDTISNDVSKGGIRLWADHDLIKNKDQMFTLVFSLSHDWTYFIPAQLVRCQPNLVTRSYYFDYGFTFDFSTMPERQDKLLMDVLEAKIRLK